MKVIKIHSGWHITQVAYYMLDLVQKHKEPVQCNFQEYTIMMFPNVINGDDEVIEPEWKERLIPKNEATNL